MKITRRDPESQDIYTMSSITTALKWHCRGRNASYPWPALGIAMLSLMTIEDKIVKNFE
jgi:hypothetical protein